MKNILNTKTDGTPALLTNVDDSGNYLIVNGTLIDASQWIGDGTYSFTVGTHTYSISKAPDNDGNYQLLKVSDYTYQFVKIVSKSIREEIEDIETALSALESDAVTKSAGGQITGGGLSFTSEGMPQQTTGSGVAMTMDTFANGGQLKWQNWDNVTVGKAKDSDKLGGAEADTDDTNSTIAKRTSSGYIYAKYFNASNGNQATMTTSSSALYANSDGFLRKCTMANFRKALHIDGYQTGIILKAGTKVLSVSTAAKSIAIFTDAQINTLLGVTGSSNANTVVFAVNGDYVAKSYYYTSPVYEKGTWYVRNHHDTNFITGPYRVNYLVIRFA